MSNGCVFCRIVSGKLESSVVAGDENAIAITDIRPFNAGHVLVVPRRHAAELSGHRSHAYFMPVRTNTVAYLDGILPCEKRPNAERSVSR